MEYINKNLRIKEWDVLVKEYGLYKGAIDSDVLVSVGLYKYANENIKFLTNLYSTNNDSDYYIYLGCMFFAIPKAFFIEVDND